MTPPPSAGFPKGATPDEHDPGQAKQFWDE